MTESQLEQIDGGVLSGLNRRQLEAVTYAGGPLLVVAGPGSGKTRVITQRIVYGVRERGFSPRSILAITFTNRAAAELRVRVDAGLERSQGVRAGTFHWMCNGLLRRYADRIGHRRDFSLLAPRESRALLTSSLDKLSTRLPIAATASAISAVKNGAEPEAEAAKMQMPVVMLTGAIESYEDTLRRAHAVDLDDLLALSVKLLSSQLDVRAACHRSLSELLVDEFQDTNPVQQILLTLLAPPDGAIVAVGDEDQAIYGWRQASVGTTKRFLHEFPGAHVIALEQSYRCTKHILRAAGCLIANNHHRLDKVLQTRNPAGERPVCYVAQDENDEARWIAGEIQSLKETYGLRWDDIAILYRINAQSRALEDAFVQFAVPYHVLSGLRFYDRADVRMVVAYLRLALNWDDDGAAAYAATGVPGIGEKRLQVLRERCETARRPLADAMIDGTLTTGLAVRTRERLREIGRRVSSIAELREGPPHQVIEAAIAVTLSDFDSLAGLDEPEASRDDLSELLSIFRELSPRRATLRDFVDRLSMGTPSAERADGVALLSLHMAKGLEFPVVFIAGLEEGLLPHRRSLQTQVDVEEERRLCYVGMTRAQKILCLSYAHVRWLRSHALAGGPSRFLAEMGPANITTRFSPLKASRPRLLSVRPGDRIDHTRWRTGTVTAVEGKGQNTLVTIEFDSGSKHRLQLCHAPLTRLKVEDSDVHRS